MIEDATVMVQVGWGRGEDVHGRGGYCNGTGRLGGGRTSMV